jgi:hypothetical protein
VCSGSAGNLLCFLVLHRGIEANPEKIKAIKEMRPPTHIKYVQKLTGCLAVLSWFISRLAERALPFLKLLWMSGPRKQVRLTSLLVMVALELGEHLLLYIVAKAKVVSMILVAEWQEPKQPQALKGVPTAGSGS